MEPHDCQGVPLAAIPIPTSFLCPITLDLMQDPVITCDGHIYERTSIERWFRSGKRTSPTTGAELSSIVLTPYVPLRRAIAEYLAMRPELAKSEAERRSLQTGAEELQRELLAKRNNFSILLREERREMQRLRAQLAIKTRTLAELRDLLREEWRETQRLRAQLAQRPSTSRKRRCMVPVLEDDVEHGATVGVSENDVEYGATDNVLEDNVEHGATDGVLEDDVEHGATVGVSENDVKYGATVGVSENDVEHGATVGAQEGDYNEGYLWV